MVQPGTVVTIDPRLVAGCLRHIPLFAGFSVEEITDIVRAFRVETLAAGAVLFREGDPGEDLVIIERGTVHVHKRTLQGSEERLAKLGAWSVVGEMSLLDGQPRSATVTAAEQTSLYRVDRQAFNVLRRNLCPAAYKTIRNLALPLCQRLREINGRIEHFYADPQRSQTLIRQRQQQLVDQLRSQGARPPLAQRSTAPLPAQRRTAPPLARRSTTSPDALPGCPRSGLGRAARPLGQPLAKDSRPQLLEWLPSVPLLRGLPAADLAVLAGVLAVRRCPADVEVCREGGAADRFFIVATGAVEVRKGLAVGSPQVLACLEPGAMLGQVALIDGQPRSASCVSLAEALLLECRAADFEMLWRASSPFAFRFVERLAVDLSWRLRQADDRFLTIFSHLGETLRELQQRLAELQRSLSEESSDIEALLEVCYAAGPPGSR